MPTLSLAQLQQYRQRTFRLDPALRLQSAADALAFVQERGFVYFWPIKGVTYPSLWAAVAGDRPVADEHDDPGHVTWGWKDEMLDKQKWYYAKILRGRATLLAFDVAPYFYALSENYGDPHRDYLELYEQGRLSREAKAIYEILLHKGPLHTVELRRLVHMTGSTSSGPFERALSELQRDFKILPVGVAQAGAWRYSFIYDLVHRYYPRLPAAARPFGRQQARTCLATRYFEAVGMATAGDLRKLFQWLLPDIERTIEQLLNLGILRLDYQLEGHSGQHFVADKLVSELYSEPD